MKWKVYSYFKTGCLTDRMSLKERRTFKKASVLGPEPLKNRVGIKSDAGGCKWIPLFCFVLCRFNCRDQSSISGYVEFKISIAH